MESLMLSHISKLKLDKVPTPSSLQKGMLGPVNGHIPAQQSLSALAPRLPFIPYKESSPALTNHQMPSRTPLFLIILIYKTHLLFTNL